MNWRVIKNTQTFFLLNWTISVCLVYSVRQHLSRVSAGYGLSSHLPLEKFKWGCWVSLTVGPFLNCCLNQACRYRGELSVRFPLLIRVVQGLSFQTAAFSLSLLSFPASAELYLNRAFCFALLCLRKGKDDLAVESLIPGLEAPVPPHAPLVHTDSVASNRAGGWWWWPSAGMVGPPRNIYKGLGRGLLLNLQLWGGFFFCIFGQWWWCFFKIFLVSIWGCFLNFKKKPLEPCYVLHITRPIL